MMMMMVGVVVVMMISSFIIDVFRVIIIVVIINHGGDDGGSGVLITATMPHFDSIDIRIHHFGFVAVRRASWPCERRGSSPCWLRFVLVGVGSR